MRSTFALTFSAVAAGAISLTIAACGGHAASGGPGKAPNYVGVSIPDAGTSLPADPSSIRRVACQPGSVSLSVGQTLVLEQDCADGVSVALSTDGSMATSGFEQWHAQAAGKSQVQLNGYCTPGKGGCPSSGRGAIDVTITAS